MEPTMFSTKQLIRNDFASFVRKAFSESHNGEKLGREKYIDLLCCELKRVADGEERRLVINLPPRHLKTFLAAICLPAWILAHDPSRRIMVITYGDQLAEHITYQIRKILMSAWFKDLFKTRVAADRSKVDDFATTKGGGVFATSVDGALAGRGADLIIFDDPLDLKDAGNIRKIQQVNERFDNAIMSRLNNPKKGQVVIIAHRLNDRDLSTHIQEQSGWRRVALPLVAARSKTYNLGFGKWHRKLGELLRPGSHTVKQLERLRTTAINPEFELFYQQGRGRGQRITILPKHFATPFTTPPLQGPVILSVDTGQRGGPLNSFSVIQAWSPQGEQHFLLDQWREQCTYPMLKDIYYSFVRRFRPSVSIIEATAMGPALIAEVRIKSCPRVVDIWPDGRSKAARLITHVPLIRGGRIRLPEAAPWRAEFIKEFVEFPSGQYDDQVDAATQFFDWISVNPCPEQPTERGVARVTTSTGQPTPFGGGSTVGSQFGVVRRYSR